MACSTIQYRLLALAVVLVPSACKDSSGDRHDGGGTAHDAGDAGGGAPDAGDVGSDAAVPPDAGTDAGQPAPDGGGGGDYCPVVGYAACGGDIVGRWAFRALCPEDPEAAAALCEHPYDNRVQCTGSGNEAVCDGSIAGTLVFHDNGSIDIDTVSTIVATWGFSDECLEAVATGATPEERCASLANDRLTCTYDGACSCQGDPMVETQTDTATYTVTDDEVQIGEDPPATYCIDGDRLTMDYAVYHPVSWRYWVLERD